MTDPDAIVPPMDVLMIGGTLHASTLPVEPHQELAPQYLHMATGEPYRLLNLTLTIPSKLDPNSAGDVWTCPTYVYGPIDTLELAQSMFMDAAARRWFMEYGRKQVEAGTPLPGVKVDEYYAQCDGEGCAGNPTMQFPGLAERARWLQHHMDTTGHKPTWSNEPPAPAASPVLVPAQEGSPE